jgi:hypothetical protein
MSHARPPSWLHEGLAVLVGLLLVAALLMAGGILATPGTPTTTETTP